MGGLSLVVAGACDPGGSDGSNVKGSGASGGNGGSGASSGSGGAFGGSDFGGSDFGGSDFGGSGAFGGSGGSGDACASNKYGGQLQPLDMYVILDRSGSMQGNAWSSVVSALTTFVQSPESDGIGVGLQFFPKKNEPTCFPFNCQPPCVANGLNCALCDPQWYLPPAVSIAPLPGVGSQIIAELNANGPSNQGTPTMPALQSAAMATTAYAAQHPDRKVVIVLASDGQPQTCNSDTTAIANVAATARNSTPSVLTFTIGIGNIPALDAIAQAGGTGQAILVDTAGAGQQFLDAMNTIRGEALGCNYLMPVPTDGDANPNKLNFTFTPEGGTPEVIPRVSDAGQCQGQAGWYYDNPTNPTTIILCPASCDYLKATDGEVNIELGCDQVVAPPR
ncbi:MAG: VWA domain-containing protein [Polyangiaceae bacterium]|nr:VWA domain-containing protein [Polyangiaceae bacterium]MCW5789781.1 VWA domain-containing protein [Polyangiaceae bacterium]